MLRWREFSGRVEGFLDLIVVMFAQLYTVIKIHVFVPIKIKGFYSM